MKKILAKSLSQPYLRAALLLALFMFPATLIRLVLYYYYREDFQNLGLGQIFTSLLVVLRFDVSMAVMLIGIPILLMLLPFRWSHHRYWQILCGGFIYIAWLSFISLMMGDLLYFGNVHRHVGSEVLTMSNDVNSMIQIALTQYRPALALLVLIAIVWYAPAEMFNQFVKTPTCLGEE